MSESFDQDSSERRWAQVLREQPDKVAGRPPNVHLRAEAAGLRPGRALDAGCEAIWLASAGWHVTAVDFSVTALEHARSTALAMGGAVAERIDWTEGDLATWRPPERAFDLVSCLYVHVAGSMEEMLTRLGRGVAPGGSLLLIGHLPVDPATGAASPAAGQRQATVDDARLVLDPGEWEIVLAEERPRPAGTGADAVVRPIHRP